MLFQISFPFTTASICNNFSLMLISLEDWALIRINGEDTIKYLQGQLTCNIASLNINHFNFSAHCNAAGKTLSNLCVFHHHHQGIGLIERRSVCNSHLQELKKYAIFSKINISIDNNAILIGAAGCEANNILSAYFVEIPSAKNPVVHDQDQSTTLIYFDLPEPRFLLITTTLICKILQLELKNLAQFYNSQQWLALDIKAGYPIIDNINKFKFIPQEINLQALNGISFHKGCYVGQEVIARVRYRGINKRALYWLTGSANNLPLIGDKLEIKLGSSWRQTGTILATCQLNNGHIWIQAVLNTNLSSDSLMRVKNDSSGILSIHPLPYLVEKNNINKYLPVNNLDITKE